MTEPEHSKFMRQAIALAKDHTPSKPFAAVIVDKSTKQVVAEGWNRSSANPIWHGEMDAIHRLAESLPDFGERDLTIYTTAEPCPMCQAAILWAGISMVVFGTSMRTLQRFGWRQLDVRAEELVARSPTFQCQVIGGVLEDECDGLFQSAKR